MKWNGNDLKAFAIGVVASMTAVVVWDIIKYRYKLLDRTKTIVEKVEKEV